MDLQLDLIILALANNQLMGIGVFLFIVSIIWLFLHFVRDVRKLKGLAHAEMQLVTLENARLNTQIQDSKIYNETLVENMPSGIVAIDLSGTINTCNQRATTLLELEEPVVGTPVERLPAPLLAAYQKTVETERVLRSEEITIQDSKGRDSLLRVDTSRLKGHEGNPLGVMLAFQDISNIKHLENQVMRQDRLAIMGTLSAGMAHEIKNPLVSIKTFAQLLPERYDDPDFRDTFSKLIGKEINRIDSIVNRVLAFARPPKPEFDHVNLHHLLQENIQLLGQQFRKNGIKLHLDLVHGPCTIYADAGQIEQVLVNLILNAVDAMPDGGELNISTETIPSEWGDEEVAALTSGVHTGANIQCKITDTGVGIDPESRERVFDPFFTTKPSGTGLGLSVVHRIMENHNASIDVQSNAKGTTFIMTLALVDCEVNA